MTAGSHINYSCGTVHLIIYYKARSSFQISTNDKLEIYHCEKKLPTYIIDIFLTCILGVVQNEMFGKY